MCIRDRPDTKFTELEARVLDIALLLHMEPVSYTHLDVYKRQVVTRLSLRQGISFRPRSRKLETQTVHLSVCLMRCPRTAVSYTHLDVYKRQRVYRTKEKGGGAPWRRTGKRLI